MRRIFFLGLFLSSAAGVQAQQSAAPAGASAPAFDAEKMLDSLRAETKRLGPLLEQLQPEAWLKHGAPYSYVEQKKSAQDEMGYLTASTSAMSKQPDKLSLALDTYLRMEALDRQVGSLVVGILRYGDPNLADLLQQTVGGSVSNRDQFRQYIVDLASQQETQYDVMDREAQRCRGILSRQPTPTGRSKQAPK